jgi:branched-chain amino acid transport system ATP-binding protein
VPSAEPLLEVRDLGSAYGRVQALKGVSLEVRSGETVCLVGGNGAGKTTLLRAISGVQPVTGGWVRFAGDDITRAPPHRRVAMGIAQVPEGRQIFGALAVADNLRLGAYLRRDSDGIAADLERVFAMFPVLKERRHTPGGALSGGQQQMLAIGRALMSRPRLLLLDEPSMGLAPLLVDQIFAAIQALKEDGVTVFLVEQNAAAALDMADRSYVVETGKVVHEGQARALLADERLREAYLGV